MGSDGWSPVPYVAYGLLMIYGNLNSFLKPTSSCSPEDPLQPTNKNGKLTEQEEFSYERKAPFLEHWASKGADQELYADPMASRLLLLLQMMSCFTCRLCLYAMWDLTWARSYPSSRWLHGHAHRMPNAHWQQGVQHSKWKPGPFLHRSTIWGWAHLFPTKLRKESWHRTRLYQLRGVKSTVSTASKVPSPGHT